MLVSSRDGQIISQDLTYTLASKVLEMLIFSRIEPMAPDFKPPEVFDLAGKILKRKMVMPFVDVAQAASKSITHEDP